MKRARLMPCTVKVSKKHVSVRCEPRGYIEPAGSSRRGSSRRACSLFVDYPSKTPHEKAKKLHAPVSRLPVEGSGSGAGRADFSVEVRAGEAAAKRAGKRVLRAARKAKIRGVRVTAQCYDHASDSYHHTKIK